MTTCVGKRDGKLIDTRFLRRLSHPERARMEAHLVSCDFCRERYRKLQLAERVAAVGPDADLDVFAPVQVDRIAEDLGLIGAPKRRPLLAFLSDVRILGGAASVLVAVALAAVFLKPAPEETLIARGGDTAAISFSTYAVGQGVPRLLAPGATVSRKEHLKLRASQGGAPVGLTGVEVFLVDASGRVEHAHLEAPEGAQKIVTVPGAVSLEGLAEGRLVAYLIAGRGDVAKLQALAKARASEKEMEAALDAGGPVDRLELILRGPPE